MERAWEQGSRRTEKQESRVTGVFFPEVVTFLAGNYFEIEYNFGVCVIFKLSIEICKSYLMFRLLFKERVTCLKTIP